ncbi:putative D-aminoacylase [Xylona heveae TC161]|uniref:Putative D-aminoacylase n=1 Tax=Xylona heveae (strain CBS 132557 / TC161) TaxID=1328760 RepID=A0A165FGQ9_XYLHT|nr:putative D-aminoacylase [Xylona heveae TC161]KZF20957.1 putative D-aminoacylase [Xylona heveae TC161]
MTERDDIVRRLQALEPLIRKLCGICGVPGVSLGVVLSGDVIFRLNLGYRNLETSAATDSDTVYPIGTIAKTFTASAIGILVSEGKLSWNTLIRDILPEFRSRDLTISQNLTVLDLLCHRGGLARSNQWWQGAGGELLQEKRQTIPFYSTLEPVGTFRSDWAYSNWGYAILGEVIERASGLRYGDFLSKRIFQPLELDCTTTAEPVAANKHNVAKPYAALDDATLHPLPQPPVHGNAIMVPAMGISSSLNDLCKYAIALLHAQRTECRGGNTSHLVLQNAKTHLAGHIFTAQGTMEKSYACGFYRSQLPSTVMGMGWNSIYVKKMPTIIPRGHCGPLIAHGGSLPGYHSAIALLPELEAGVVVCTNSIGLGDASGWISMALVEALIDSPNPTDFTQYATEAAIGHVNSVPALQDKLRKAKRSSMFVPPRPLSQYTGRYRDADRDWVIDIRHRDAGHLEVLFQGLESQVWPLTYYEDDTFLWLTERNEQARRGRMTTYPQGDVFKLIFMGNGSLIDRVCWPQEPGLAKEKQCFTKEETAQ